ncbi:HAD family hydrolase [Streptomyces sp. NBC_01304]|uniref:HAD family hydrolase n=1 Tax=Streptomyces sp. NBC_01304 TaxID=2903818 RepID=UPI002E15FB54|nr:HAD family hydrolase [Streptomyces sp. NBC_01304]
MAIMGVLLDFSGTIFRMESSESWLRAVLADARIPMPEPELLHHAAQLEAMGALPGGAPLAVVPDHLAHLWAARDESAEHHRVAYTSLAQQVALPGTGLHDALYERHMTPAAWHPYPDTAEVLTTLNLQGIRVGVLSNIGWDLRPVIRAHGLDDYVNAYTLSYEHGIQKPDPRLFRIACDSIGVAPHEVLMVGDDRRADGGAAELGCSVHYVDHLPAAERPLGLMPVLDLIGQQH